ncbi:MAG: lipid A deacylase LpxR family protein [Alphaproteobacteria bacterium]|nr:lipid A deacylase LpxR family protein [Alphaproteobacteria bacterium]
MKRSMLLWLILTLLQGPAFAREQIVTLTSENDAYTRTGDGNYTNGLRFSWLDAENVPPAWLRDIADWLPMSALSEASVPVYSLGQNLYTPSNLQPFTAQPADRPYAAHLYGAVGLTSGDIGQVDELELSLGWVGPGALGKAVQTRYHELIGVQKPNGWAHQLHEEPTLGLSWQRRWPRRLALPVGQGLISTMPYVGVSVGNARTHSMAGAILSWRSNRYELADLPIRVAPGLPGTGYFTTAPRVNWVLFAGIEGRAVARDIFLDGNTFDSSPSVRKKNLVSDLSAGVMLTYNRYQLGYTTVYRTKEFYGQPEGQVFGALSLGVKF